MRQLPHWAVLLFVAAMVVGCSADASNVTALEGTGEVGERVDPTPTPAVFGSEAEQNETETKQADVDAEPVDEASDSADDADQGVEESVVSVADGPCGLVGDSVVERLAESTVASRLDSALQGLPLCLYEATSGVRVQVVSLPADDWIAALPQILDIVQSSGLLDDPENQAKFAEAEELLADDGGVAGEAACDVFSLMVELQGLPPGSEQVVNFVPNADSPLSVTGQRCDQGVFSSVVLEAPGLVDDQQTLERVNDALTAVHAAGTDT